MIMDQELCESIYAKASLRCADSDAIRHVFLPYPGDQATLDGDPAYYRAAGQVRCHAAS